MNYKVHSKRSSISFVTYGEVCVGVGGVATGAGGVGLEGD